VNPAVGEQEQEVHPLPGQRHARPPRVGVIVQVHLGDQGWRVEPAGPVQGAVPGEDEPFRTVSRHSRKQSAVQGPRVLALGVAGELADAGAWLRTRPGRRRQCCLPGANFRPDVDASVKSVQRFAPNRGG